MEGGADEPTWEGWCCEAPAGWYTWCPERHWQEAPIRTCWEAWGSNMSSAPALLGAGERTEWPVQTAGDQPHSYLHGGLGLHLHSALVSLPSSPQPDHKHRDGGAPHFPSLLSWSLVTWSHTLGGSCQALDFCVSSCLPSSQMSRNPQSPYG